MSDQHDGTHVTHCCVLHYCKYGESTCPVVTKRLKQKYLCEQCSDVLAEAENTLCEITLVRELATSLEGVES